MAERFRDWYARTHAPLVWRFGESGERIQDCMERLGNDLAEYLIETAKRQSGALPQPGQDND